MEIDSLNLPESYFAFLKDYNMNDNGLISIMHANFLHEFSMYATQNPKDSLQKAISIYQTEGFEKASDIVKSMIDINSTGFTRELFFTVFYIDIIKSKDMEIFEAIYDSSFTNQPYFLNTINRECAHLKEYLSNQNTGYAKLSNIKSSNVAGLIDTISHKYKNKVLYIDFWAPWCSPCMNEMTYSKNIQEYFRNDDVVFLFLANRCKEDSWKATIANKKLTGEHILLTNDQFNELSGLLDITGIPHYTLIDKKGNIVLKDAPRPSDKEQLITEINRQMNK